MNWEKIKKLNVRIEVPLKVKQFLFLVLGTYFLTALFVEMVDYLPLMAYRIAGILVPFITAVPAMIVFWQRKMSFKDIFGKKIAFQVFMGTVVAAVMLLVLNLVNGGLSYSIAVTLFDRYNWYKIYISVYYLLIVNFTEEFVYRVVLQGFIADSMKKANFLAPLITAAFFAFGHYWVGGLSVVGATFVMGIIWGYLKYLYNNSFYVASSVAHGLYNYGIVLIPYITECL